jgi:hypothetical protein
VVYRLDGDAAGARARWSALAATFGAMAPALFTAVTFGKLGLVRGVYLGIVLALLLLLALVRIVAGYRRLRRHLEAFCVRERDGGGLSVTTRLGQYEIAGESITRVRELGGVLGGLRVELAPGWDGSRDSPETIDIPRGGSAYAQLRTSLARAHPVEPPRKRSRAARVALSVAVIAGIFFLPFFLDAIFGKSKVVAVALVLVVWAGLRLMLRR